MSWTVTGTNDAPVGVADTIYTNVRFGHSISVNDAWLLANDIDSGNQALTVASVTDGAVADASHSGTTTTVTPNTHRPHSGTVTSDFTYIASDGSLSSAATTVTIIRGSDNAVITGGAGNDILIESRGISTTLNGGAGNDILVAGTAADTLTGGSGSDRFVFAAGDGNPTISGSGTNGAISGYDVITDFTPGQTALTSEKLTFAGAAVVADGITDGTNSTLQLHILSTVKSHSITNGIVTFDDANLFGGAVSLTTAGDLAAAVQYLQANDLGNAGAAVAFTATISGVTHTYVFIQGTNAGGSANANSNVLVDVLNVSASSLAASGGQLSLLDNVAPNAPAITAIATDSGTVGDHITSDTTLTISGTAEANSTVTVFQNGTSIGTTTADGNGNWSKADGNTLVNGTTYQLTATATDAAGNTSVASAQYAVTIDTTAPAAPGAPGTPDLTAASDFWLVEYGQHHE